MRKETLFIFLIAVTSIFWFANFNYPNNYLLNGFYSFLVISAVYFVFKIVLEETISKGIKDSKTRYSFRKMISILSIVFFLIPIIGIWAENAQTLTVAYGLLGAGVAIALQDVFKNFAGGISIFITGVYRVEDRIEINSKFGDVIDIGILYTTFMEMKEWVEGEQSTGRLTIVPNSYVLTSTINNYTKDHNFIWDEIEIPITYDSDWKEAIKKIQDIVRRETKDISDKADKSISKLGQKYYIDNKVVDPTIFLKLTDNWITFYIRYITEVRERRLLQTKINKLILEEIQKSGNIKIASTSLDITAFPEVTINENDKKS